MSTQPVKGEGPSSQPLFLTSAVVLGTGETVRAGILRARQVRIDYNMLGGLKEGSTFQLNVFDNIHFMAVVTGIQQQSTGTTTWNGHLEDSLESQFVLVARGGRVSGSIRSPQGVYRVRPFTGEEHMIEEVDLASLPPENASERTSDEPVPAQSLQAASLQVAAAPVEITVLVAYTPAVGNAEGGADAMRDMAQLMVEETNLSFVNSGISIYLRLVGSVETPYAETGYLDVDVLRLQKPADGYLDELHVTRDATAADIVVLLVHNADFCGEAAGIMNNISWTLQSSAFVVVGEDCASANYSFGHEIGHILGARHDWYNDANPSPSYNHGLVSLTGGWRTMMAYPNLCKAHEVQCPRILYWSNPDLHLSGQPLGVPVGTSTGCLEGSLSNPPCDADNRRRLEETAFTVSRFRVEAPPLPELLSVTGVPAWVEPGTAFTVRVRATNDGAAAPGTLVASVLYSDGTSDLTLSADTPNGAQLEVLEPGQGMMYAPTCQAVGAATNHHVKARWEVWEPGVEHSLALTIVAKKPGKLWLRFRMVQDGLSPCEIYQAVTLPGAFSALDALGWKSARLAVQVGPAESADEPNDNAWDAFPITSRQPQFHALEPAGDIDSVRFKLSATSSLRLETQADPNADTFLTLRSEDYQVIDFDDDSGAGANAMLVRTCADNPLPPGVYIAQVNEYGDDAAVAAYRLSLETTACNMAVQAYHLPMILFPLP